MTRCLCFIASNGSFGFRVEKFSLEINVLPKVSNSLEMLIKTSKSLSNCFHTLLFLVTAQITHKRVGVSHDTCFQSTFICTVIIEIIPTKFYSEVENQPWKFPKDY